MEQDGADSVVAAGMIPGFVREMESGEPVSGYPLDPDDVDHSDPHTQYGEAMRLCEYAHDVINEHLGVFAKNDYPEIAELEFASMRRAPALVPPNFAFTNTRLMKFNQTLPEYHTKPFPDDELIQIAVERWEQIYQMELTEAKVPAQQRTRQHGQLRSRPMLEPCRPRRRAVKTRRSP